MEKNSSKNLVIPSIQTFQSTGSATGNPRNKCALKPGHSLMDWIKLGNTDIDLSGTRGRIIPVTKEELSKHNTRNDAWIAIQDVVYNITKYMDFHPGGVEELMRGVGTDATKLFNETHAWVNYAQLLNKCRIGPLTNTVNRDSVIKGPNTAYIKPKISFVKPLPTLQNVDVQPRLDWIQKRDELTLYFYTKPFCNPGCLLRHLNKNNNCIEVLIFISHYIHKFEFELQGRIKWPAKGVSISSESGKIEIKLNKHEEQLELWNNLGKYTKTKLLANDFHMDLEFKIFIKKQFNEDSFAISIKNEIMTYYLPLGYHLTLETIINKSKINKPYTPVPKKYFDKYINIDEDMDCKHFLIKQYSNPNSFSKYLCSLEKDTVLKISLPKGNFKLSSLSAHRRVCFLAAGSGVTPFLGLIDHLLKRNTNRLEILKLLYFNKTRPDIWCQEILSQLSSEDKRFEFINILSNAEETWMGLKGRVSSELLFSITNKTMDNITYIAICGPNGFNTNVEEILKNFQFPKENIFIF